MNKSVESTGFSSYRVDIYIWMREKRPIFINGEQKRMKYIVKWILVNKRDLSCLRDRIFHVEDEREDVSVAGDPREMSDNDFIELEDDDETEGDLIIGESSSDSNSSEGTQTPRLAS